MDWRTFFFPTSIPYTIIYKTHSPDIKTTQVKTRNSTSSTVQLQRQFETVSVIKYTDLAGLNFKKKTLMLQCICNCSIFH